MSKEQQNFSGESSAAYGSVKNLVNTGKTTIAKIRQFLHSKTTYTKFSQPTRKFR